MLFCNNLPKIHPIYVIWAPVSLMKTNRTLYQISRNIILEGRHIYVYHVNVRTPPPPGKTRVSMRILCIKHVLLPFGRIHVSQNSVFSLKQKTSFSYQMRIFCIKHLLLPFGRILILQNGVLSLSLFLVSP